MEYYFYDHKITADKERWGDLKNLEKLLGLKQLNKVRDIKSINENFVAFIHPSDGVRDNMSSWEKILEGRSGSWIIFVSSELSALRNCQSKSAMNITQPLDSTVSRLDANHELIKEFLISCQSDTGPDLQLLEGRGWPEKVLSRYLLGLANLQLEEDKLQAMKIQDAAVIKEYNEFAKDYTLGETDTISLDILKKLLNKIKPNVY